MKRHLAFGTLVFGLGLTLSGCTRTVRIGRVLDNPQRYQNRLVAVRGRVTGGVNAVVASGYRVEDGSGAITVISNTSPPRKGAEVKVTGRVQGGVTVLGNSYGTTLRERDRKVHY